MNHFVVYLIAIGCVVCGVKCDRFTQNTTVAAMNVESTLGTPALLIDPTSVTNQNNQNTTDAQFETILKISPFLNDTNDSDETSTIMNAYSSTTLTTTASAAAAASSVPDAAPAMATTTEIEAATFDRRKSNSSGAEVAITDDIADDDYETMAMSKQFGFLSNTRAPCECASGVCGCCTGMFFSALRQLGCLNITYAPEDFSFELKMIMNNAVLYKSRVTGRNPPPVCVRVPRLSFIKLCASFYDLYFVGRNMHVCLEMGAYFRDSEVFNRSFDCMSVGDRGVHFVDPEDGGGLFHKPGTDADVDAGFDDVEDYDENAVVRRRKQLPTN